MPVTKSAIKKLRQDKRRTAVNKKTKNQLTVALKGAKKSKKVSLEQAYSKIDKAAKSGAIHKNKAARLKSQASKSVPRKVGSKKTASKTTKVAKKSSAKTKKSK